MRLGEEDAGIRVTRESGGQQAFTRSARSRTDAMGDVARGGCEPLAEGRGIEWSDCEDSDAALMTTWMAREVRSRPRGRRGKGRIDDGEEFVHPWKVYEPGRLQRTHCGDGEFCGDVEPIFVRWVEFCIVARLPCVR